MPLLWDCPLRLFNNNWKITWTESNHSKSVYFIGVISSPYYYSFISIRKMLNISNSQWILKCTFYLSQHPSLRVLLFSKNDLKPRTICFLQIEQLFLVECIIYNIFLINLNNGNNCVFCFCLVLWTAHCMRNGKFLL